MLGIGRFPILQEIFEEQLYRFDMTLNHHSTGSSSGKWLSAMRPLCSHACRIPGNNGCIDQKLKSNHRKKNFPEPGGFQILFVNFVNIMNFTFSCSTQKKNKKQFFSKCRTTFIMAKTCARIDFQCATCIHISRSGEAQFFGFKNPFLFLWGKPRNVILCIATGSS